MCGSRTLAECLVLWFCVSLLCDRHRPSSVHPYRVGVPVVGRTVFRLPINQSILFRKMFFVAAAGLGALAAPAASFAPLRDRARRPSELCEDQSCLCERAMTHV